MLKSLNAILIKYIDLYKLSPQNSDFDIMLLIEYITFEKQCYNSYNLQIN